LPLEQREARREGGKNESEESGSIINVGVTKEENKKKRKIREHTQKPNP
jgi:hypothetical protein